MDTNHKNPLNYAYFDITDTEGLRQWITARPSGIWHISLGVAGAEETPAPLDYLTVSGWFEEEIGENEDWLYEKTNARECVFRLVKQMPVTSGSVEVREA